MNSSQLPENDSRASRSESGTAIAAGFVYFAFLLAIGVLLEAVSQQWLVPRAGEATALAIGLALMLPCAWLMNGFVTRRFGIESPWPLGAIVAGTTFVLLGVADLVLLALLDPILAEAIMNHGWIEARFVAQIFMSVLPVVYQGR